MMSEISLNILDIAQNSIAADADLIEIHIKADFFLDRLSVMIRDNGRGMSKEQLSMVCDPFFTTRVSRNVGLGIPFFKMAAEIAGGTFSIESFACIGTSVNATFQLSHLNRMPMGDIAATLCSLICANPYIDFVLKYEVNNSGFVVDTRELRLALADMSLSSNVISANITEIINIKLSAVGDRF